MPIAGGLALVLAILMLAACGDGHSSSQNNSPPPAAPHPAQTSAQKIAALEDSGAIPRLDRSPALAGPDTDGNGIRDDIDAYIEGKSFSAPQKAAVQQMARVLQASLLVDATDKAAAKTIAIADDAAINCMFSKFPIESSGAIGEDIEKLTVNTKERMKAYLAYNRALDGTTGSVPESEVDTCE